MILSPQNLTRSQDSLDPLRFLFAGRLLGLSILLLLCEATLQAFCRRLEWDKVWKDHDGCGEGRERWIFSQSSTTSGALTGVQFDGVALETPTR